MKTALVAAGLMVSVGLLIACGSDDGADDVKATGGKSAGGSSSGGTTSTGGSSAGGTPAGAVDSCGAGLALVDPGSSKELYGTSGAFNFAWLAIGDTSKADDVGVTRKDGVVVGECEATSVVNFAAPDNSVFKDWGSELDLHLNVKNVGENSDQADDQYLSANLSQYKGLAFNAKSLGPDAKVQLKILVATSAQTPKEYGGECAGDACYNFPAAYYDLEKGKETFIQIDFSTLEPKGDKLDKVMKLGFYIAPAGTKTGTFSAPAKEYQIQLSHVGFYK